ISDLSPIANSSNAETEDEILVFTSKGVIQNVVKKLNLNIQYFTQGRILDLEQYKNVPVEVNFLVSDSILNTVNFNFYIDIISETNFEYRVNEDDIPETKSFGENIPTFFGGIVITPKDINAGGSYRVKVTPLNYVVDNLR